MGKNYYLKISSFRDLEDAISKSKLEAQLAKNRVELSLFKVQLSLSPKNIISSIKDYLTKTFFKSTLKWIEKKIIFRK